jgi:hypothetical protein
VRWQKREARDQAEHCGGAERKVGRAAAAAAAAAARASARTRASTTPRHCAASARSR